MFQQNKLHFAILGLILAVLASVVPVQYLNDSWRLPLGLGLFLGFCWFSFRLFSKSAQMEGNNDPVMLFDIVMMFPGAYLIASLGMWLMLATSDLQWNVLGGLCFALVLNHFARAFKFHSWD